MASLVLYLAKRSQVKAVSHYLKPWGGPCLTALQKLNLQACAKQTESVLTNVLFADVPI